MYPAEMLDELERLKSLTDSKNPYVSDDVAWSEFVGFLVQNADELIRLARARVTTRQPKCGDCGAEMWVVHQSSRALRFQCEQCRLIIVSLAPPEGPV